MNQDGTYVLVDWTEYTRDSQGRVTHSVNMRGQETDATFACCGEDWRKNSDGREVNTTYDELKRTETRTEVDGATGQSICSTYTYDAAGRIQNEVRNGGDLSQTTSYTYDLRGRVLTTTTPDGLTARTDYEYGNNVLSTARYAPQLASEGDGPSTITTCYLDGRVKSITGTAQVARFYTYGVNSDGSQWTKVCISEENGPRWTKTTVDMVGRTLKEEQPSTTTGGIQRTQYTYNEKGQLWKVETYYDIDSSENLITRQISQYDDFGNVRLQGLDVNADGVLTFTSVDRISGTGSQYVEIDGDWYMVNTTTNYPELLSNRTILTYAKSRLTGHAQETAPTGISGILTAEQISINAYDKTTISQTWTDRENKQVTQRVIPAVGLERISVTENGYQASSTSTAAGDVTTFSYDDLGRRTEVTDPRTGTSYTRYNALGQVYETEDAAENVTEYGYDKNGLLEWVEDPLDQKIYYTYNLRGQQTGVYGATYPVKYVYNSYGQQTDMYTYRGTDTANLIDTETEFNSLALSSFDNTHWTYQPSTGLLQSKTDAGNKTVTYDYWPQDHQLKRRTWARNSGAIYTDYAYENYTRQLESVDYSDSTPDISYTYTRLGQIFTVEDGQGSRLFEYTVEGTLDVESLTAYGSGTAIYVIDHAEDEYGRSEGFDLRFDGSATSTLSVDFGYSATNGRLETINSRVGNYSTYSKYYYVDNSDLIDGHSINASCNLTSFFYDRTVYEDHRNLIDRVENGVDSSSDYRSNTATTRKSYYDYTNDASGRRTARTDWYKPSTTATTQNNSFDYNEHNELEGADFGSDVYAYAYDNIGNRSVSTKNSTPTTYAVDELNQYDSVGTATFRYDDDGNLETDGTWICTWNAENRLSEMRTWHADEEPVSGDEKLQFLYDYNGRRYKKIIYRYDGSVWNETESSTFTWNGDRIIYITNSSAAIKRAFVWGQEGKIITMYFNTRSPFYYGYDGNKNVSDLFYAGAYRYHYTYDAFGNRTSSNSSITTYYNHFEFGSEYVDPETKWLAYKYRYYSPQIGRFINRDPIGEQGGLNLYGFVGNSPIVYSDFLGKFPGENKSYGPTTTARGRRRTPDFGGSQGEGYTNLSEKNVSGDVERTWYSYKKNKNYFGKKDFYEVYCHGSRDGQFREPGGQKVICPETVYRNMVLDGYVQEDNVLLIACYTARGGEKSAARKLARLTNAKILLAPTGTAKVRHVQNLRHLVAETDGTWYKFIGGGYVIRDYKTRYIEFSDD